MLPLPLFTLGLPDGMLPSSARHATPAGDAGTGGHGFAVLFGVLMEEGLGQTPDLTQRLVERLPPELLQAVETAIAGGMSLPEVARMIRPRVEQFEAEIRGELDRLIGQRLAVPARRGAELPVPTPVEARQAPTDTRWALLDDAGELFDDTGELLQPRLRELVDAGRTLRDTPARELIAKVVATPTDTVRPTAPPEGIAPALIRPLSAELPQALLQTVKPFHPALADRHLQLPLRLGETGWGHALADRVGWLVGRGQHAAELRLNPPNLGPLEVRVAVHQDQASVTFLSQHAAVREAIEAALPRLREMFVQQDLQLVQVDVGQGEAGAGRSRGGSGSQQAGKGHGGADDTAGTEPDAEAPATPIPVVGLLDLYV